MHTVAGTPDSFFFEKKLWNEGFEKVMGLDEVGRGCLAGPVVAAGVMLRPGAAIPGISDSKQLSAKKRRDLAAAIKSNCLCWTVACCDIEEIRILNILKASLKAMEKCVGSAAPAPDYLLVDGNQSLPSLLVPSTSVIKGDALSASIGAASILAKVYRDEYMAKLHLEYPEFGWDRNVGYPTAEHYRALADYGITPHHRTSFRLRTTLVYPEKRESSRSGYVNQLLPVGCGSGQL